MRKPYDVALGPHNDYSYDKQFIGGRGARRAQQRYTRTVSRLARRRAERAWKKDERLHS
jgi:hypothetical protein